MGARKLAIIDLGTNTFHLLIVEVKSESITVLFKEKVAVKIGEGGINRSEITAAAEARAIKTLRYFKKVIGKFKVEEVYASATSAIRNAKNGTAIVNRIKDELQINVEIIDGEKEAYLIFRGVKKAMKIGKDNALIIDIGGGSVEFIIANDEGVKWLQSFEIGGQRLFERFHKHDPIHQNDIKELYQHFDQTLASLKTAVKNMRPKKLIGCSGTFDTLLDINAAYHETERKDDSSQALDFRDFERIYHEIIKKDVSDRLKIPGMIAMRAEMIVVACTLIRYCLELADFDSFFVSAYALKEGYLESILQNEVLS